MKRGVEKNMLNYITGMQPAEFRNVGDINTREQTTQFLSKNLRKKD